MKTSYRQLCDLLGATMFLFVLSGCLGSPLAFGLHIKAMKLDRTHAKGYGTEIAVSLNYCEKGDRTKGYVSLEVWYGDVEGREQLSLLGVKNVPLNGSSCYQESLRVTLPAKVLYGLRHIHASARFYGEKAWASRRLLITGRPRIQVRQLKSAKRNSQLGEKLSISYQIRNVGFSRVPDSFDAGFYVATSTKISLKELKFHRVRVEPLLAKASFPKKGLGTLLIELPKNVGQYYIGAVGKLPSKKPLQKSEPQSSMKKQMEAKLALHDKPHSSKRRLEQTLKKASK